VNNFCLSLFEFVRPFKQAGDEDGDRVILRPNADVMNCLFRQEISAAQAEPGNRCRIVLVYEDTATRERLLRLGDRLSAIFGDDIDFDGAWWRLDFLSDPALANLAAGTAAKADIIAFSLNPEGAWRGLLRKWSAKWANKRTGKEGAMLVLMGSESEALAFSSLPANPFRDIARRANMDYLEPVQGQSPAAGANLLDLFLKQASHVTFVQETAANPGASSAHWGINE
jgi:hypothetical protein